MSGSAACMVAAASCRIRPPRVMCPGFRTPSGVWAPAGCDHAVFHPCLLRDGAPVPFSSRSSEPQDGLEVPARQDRRRATARSGRCARGIQDSGEDGRPPVPARGESPYLCGRPWRRCCLACRWPTRTRRRQRLGIHHIPGPPAFGPPRAHKASRQARGGPALQTTTFAATARKAAEHVWGPRGSSPNHSLRLLDAVRPLDAAPPLDAVPRKGRANPCVSGERG